jgi:hypothetical protein
MSVLTAHVALVSDTASVTLSEVSPVAAALQKQVTRDFGHLWGVHATVDAFGKLESVPVDYWPVILRDDISEPGAAGYHTDDNGQPFSLIQVDNSWPLTASHETLEMLADPFGSRTIAGAPPAQLAEAQGPVPKLSRVVYLVEVCDPCESDQCAYSVNGITVSDFITHHYYDPTDAGSVRYSYRGNIHKPHMVLEGGYVSFGNPVNNNWYQIIVQNGQVGFRDLGVLQTKEGKSLREQVDHRVREIRRNERYRTKPLAAAARAGAGATPFAETGAARAKSLREYVKGLK